jgi:hypothetical protein
VFPKEAIGRAPLTEVPQSNSVILYCKRHSNIERIIASVRFQFANVPMRVTLSELVSAVLKSAESLGVIILTETEVRIRQLMLSHRWKQNLMSYGPLAGCQPSTDQ